MMEGTAEDDGGSSHQVAIMDEGRETVYVHLPPNITLDGNSIVTTELTEDGQQVFRILGVTQNEEVVVNQTEEPMEQDIPSSEEIDVQTTESQNLELTVMSQTDSNVQVVETLAEELTIKDRDDEDILVTDTGNQEVIIVEAGDQEVLISETGDQEIIVTETGDQEIIVTEAGDQELIVTEAGDQELIVTEAGDQEIIVTETGDQEMIVTETGDQDIIVTEAGDHQVADENQITDAVTDSHQAAVTESGNQVIQVTESSGQVRQVVIQNEEFGDGIAPADGNNLQDVALFQQALALLHQQSQGNVVVTEKDDAIYIMHEDPSGQGHELQLAQFQQASHGEDVNVLDTVKTPNTGLVGTREGMVNIINPETGDVEPVALSSLESQQAAADLTPGTSLETGLQSTPPLPPATPIIVAPAKRRPGRPRKEHRLAVQQLAPPKPQQDADRDNEPVTLGPTGRPRRKAAIKLLKNWEAMKKEDDPAVSMRAETDTVSKKSVGRPPMSAMKRSNKENLPPPQRNSPSNEHPATVNIKIRDKDALQVLSDIGIHMLYYCRRCTFFSTQLMAVAHHIMECRQQPLPEADMEKAADPAHTSQVLLDASLQSITKSEAKPDQELIEIDEHNYAAEVDIVANEPVEEELEMPKEVPCVQCHLCSEVMDFSQLPAHLRCVHADVDGEVAARVVEAAGQLPVEGAETPAEDPTVLAVVGEAENATETIVTLMDEGEAQTEACSLNAIAEGSETTVTVRDTPFVCQLHQLVFGSQADLTRHHMEEHWGVTKEKVTYTEAQQEEQLPAPVKRGRGRPPKNFPRVPVDDLDDDVKDPDYDVKSEALLPQFTTQSSAGSAKCQFCYKRFATYKSMKKHVSAHHTADKLLPVTCPQCKKSYRNRIQLRNHVRTVHEGKKRKQGYRAYPSSARRKTFMCEECGYTTPELCRLKNHKMSVHDGQYPYQCDTCDYKTNEKADMRRHMHKHQGIKRYPCQFCTYRTDQRWLLVNHCQRQHNVQLDKHSRNTRGSFWSNQRRRKDNTTEMSSLISPVVATEHIGGDLAFTQEIVIEQGIGNFSSNPEDGYLVPIVRTNEHGEEEVTMYTISNGGSEEQVTIETIEEQAQGGEVVYIRDDGTVLEREQAALMLLAVGPNQPGDQPEAC